MKNILWGIIIALFLYATNSTAEENLPKGYKFQNIPAVCASNEQVTQDLQNKGYEVLNLSLGRKNADPEGEPVFMVTYYVNVQAQSTAAVINIPTSNDACIMFLTYDLVVTIPAN